MADQFISRCGCDCSGCEHTTKDGCPGCLASAGKVFWGECALVTCCLAKGHDHCGQCQAFPCTALKEQSPEEIHVLEAWNEKGYDAWRALSNTPDSGIVSEGCGTNTKEESVGIVGACGLVCSECDAYKATQANDPAAIATIAMEWSKMWNSDVKQEYVWCDGCLSESDRKCGNCAGCSIRACVVERGFANCAGCDNYACETITKFFELFPCAKGKLDEIRATQQ